jgi:hypothetical protein
LLGFAWFLDYRNSFGSRGGLVYLFVFLTTMPILTIPQWLRQWRYLEMESLRPIERSRFLGELGLAIVFDVALVWAMLAAAIVIWVMLLKRGTMEGINVAIALCQSALMQIFLLAGVLWLMRLRSGGLIVAATVLIALPLIVLMDIALLDFYRYREIALLSSLVLAGVGAMIAVDARGRWVLTEMG